MDDYTASLTAVGIALRAARRRRVGERWPQFSLPDRHRRALPGRAAPSSRPARGTAADAGPRGARTGAVLRDRPQVRVWSTGTVGRRWPTAPERSPAGGVVRVRGRLDQRGARRPRRRRAAGGHAGAGDLLRPRPSRRPSRRDGCRCGSGWTTRRSTASPATASRRSRRRRTAAARWSTPTTRGDDARPGDADLLAGHVRSILPGSGRAGALDALPVHPDPRPRLRARPGARPSRRVVVGLGAAHGFKFAPTFGRLLADLATGERDAVSPTFAPRPAGAHRPVVRRPLAGVAARRWRAERDLDPRPEARGVSVRISRGCAGSRWPGESREVVLTG